MCSEVWLIWVWFTLKSIVALFEANDTLNTLKILNIPDTLKRLTSRQLTQGRNMMLEMVNDKGRDKIIRVIVT